MSGKIKKRYTKEELEAQLEPAASRIPKEMCPEGKDIIQVTLPWLDDVNDCIEVYLARENGKIKFQFFKVIDGRKVYRSKDRYYSWDELQVFNKRGYHLGALDAVTGVQIKEAKKGRRLSDV